MRQARQFKQGNLLNAYLIRIAAFVVAAVAAAVAVGAALGLDQCARRLDLRDVSVLLRRRRRCRNGGSDGGQGASGRGARLKGESAVQAREEAGEHKKKATHTAAQK